MLKSHKAQTLAYIYAAITVLLWSTVATAFKISLRYVDTFQLLFIASTSACIFLLVVIIIQGNAKAIFSLQRASYYRLALFGLLNPFLYYLVLFKAYDLLPAQIAQALNYTWAISLMLLSIPILKHKAIYICVRVASINEFK